MSERALGDVSRETSERLQVYADLVRKWNPSINLVSRTDLGRLEARHFADSAQVFSLAPEVNQWVDFGSGGGFPGAICAILAADKGWATNFTLVEADRRKATFLSTVSRETNTPFEVRCERIEALPRLAAGVISARALAPLPKLLAWIARHQAPGGVALLPKGKGHVQEIAAAKIDWTFHYQLHKSLTAVEAAIVEVREVERAE